MSETTYDSGTCRWDYQPIGPYLVIWVIVEPPQERREVWVDTLEQAVHLFPLPPLAGQRACIGDGRRETIAGWVMEPEPVFLGCQAFFDALVMFRDPIEVLLWEAEARMYSTGPDG